MDSPSAPPQTPGQITVLVTGVSGGGVGCGIVEALRRAGNYRILGTDITPYSVGLFKVDSGFVVPPASDIAYLPALLSICKRNNVAVLIPGSEPELFALTRNREAVERAGLTLLANPHALVAACRDKWSMFGLFREKGVPTPDSSLPEGANAFIERHGFPFLLKARVGSGSRNLFVTRDAGEYAFYSRYLAAAKVDFFLQEYVGTAQDEYTVGVVCRRDGSVVGSITVHRFLQGLSSQHDLQVGGQRVHTSTGISQGVVEDNEVVQRQCEAYAVKLGVRGPANFQGRLVNGTFVVFELNPRFSGTTPFRAAAGFNDADLVLRDFALHQPVTRPAFRSGLVALRGLENIFVTPEQIRQNEAST